MHQSISWSSVLSGLLIAFLIMFGLVGLGMALGGTSFDDNTTIRGAGIFTGVWFVASSVISVFMGSYFAARISKFQSGRMGSAQGLVIAALFLGTFLYQSFSTVINRENLNLNSYKIADQPSVINSFTGLVEDSLGNMSFRSGSHVAAEGVASRLLQGNTEAARNYLAAQSGMVPEDAEIRISQLMPVAERIVYEAKNRIGEMLEATGWYLFFLVMLGATSSVFGGAIGSVANFRNPLSREQFSAQEYSHA